MDSGEWERRHYDKLLKLYNRPEIVEILQGLRLGPSYVTYLERRQLVDQGIGVWTI